jgi:hypothetical protein
MSYAILTVTYEFGYPDMTGRIHSMKDGGSSYLIKNCGKECHILIKLAKNLRELEDDVLLPPGILGRQLTEEQLSTEVCASHIFLLPVLISFVFPFQCIF